ncbi:MAG: hypothetical protein ACRDTD_21230, partial [Pseudonocardiaceae bacterium]
MEEELLLVDPDDGRALAVAGAVLHDAAVHGRQLAGEGLTAELTCEQIETKYSAVHIAQRAGVGAAAVAAGSRSGSPSRWRPGGRPGNRTAA